MEIFIIQHSVTKAFHAPDAGVISDVLPIAVKALSVIGIDADKYQSWDDRICNIPASVRPLA